jgi:hypothetical protein
MLLMKKTNKKYYAGKIFSTTDSNPAPNDKLQTNVKRTAQQLQSNKIEVKNLLKAYFLQTYSDVLSRIYTAGVMGNIQVESAGFNETLLVPDSHGTTAYGLLQWNSGTYPNAVANAGPTVNSQINFLFSNQKFADFIHQLNKLSSSQTNAAYVAYIFARYFEGCQNCKDYNAYLANQNNRSKFATTFYTSFNTAGDPLNW